MTFWACWLFWAYLIRKLKFFYISCRILANKNYAAFVRLLTHFKICSIRAVDPQNLFRMNRNRVVWWRQDFHGAVNWISKNFIGTILHSLLAGLGEECLNLLKVRASLGINFLKSLVFFLQMTQLFELNFIFFKFFK